MAVSATPIALGKKVNYLATLSFSELDICNSDVVFKERDNGERYIIENLSYALFVHYF